MIVVLPVCHKDADASLRNLKWIRELDGQSPFHCVVSHDTGFDASSVLQSARLAFTEVSELTYPPPKPKSWPGPENVAWQRAAFHIHISVRQPWLWWEQDAVPIRKGWLTELAEEYKSCRKPFMGALCTMGKPHHLTGIAVYPPNVPQRSPAMMMASRIPFDGADCVAVLAESFITAKIQVDNSRNQDTWQTSEDLSRLNPSTVLYHRCKDSSLLDLLNRKEPESKPEAPKGTSFLQSVLSRFTTPANVGDQNDITVVITNYRREERLWRAFQSCLDAGVENIVVSSSGATDAVCEMHLKMMKSYPNIIITSRSDDQGCNETWMRGVEHAKTAWVHILHDDDLILPEFGKLTQLVKQHPDAGFFHWDAISHGTEQPIKFRQFPKFSEGMMQSKNLMPILNNNKNRSISPVVGLFRKSDLLTILKEARDSFSSADFHTTPSMMVGNDLLIWIRACQKYRQFYYINRPLAAFGFWEGSTTCKDVASGGIVLLQIYNRVRNYVRDSNDLRLNLSMVTLMAIDVLHPKETAQTLLEIMEKARFKSAVMLTDLKKYKPKDSIQEQISFVQHEEREFRPMVRGACFDHEVACIRKPADYLNGASHILFAEWDSGIRCPESWKPEWLDYDFIGAPWPPRNELGWPPCTTENSVGNTGFSLRSAKFCQLSKQADDEHQWDVTRCVHDSWLCLTMRPWLIQNGIKFAPPDIAAAFSNENRLHRRQFGFHGKQTFFFNHWGTPERPIWRKQ